MDNGRLPVVRLHQQHRTNTNTNTNTRDKRENRNPTMKKTIAIAAASLVGVLALTACSTGTTEAPTSTPTAVAPLDREAPSYSLTDNASLTEGESLFVAAVEEYDQIDYTATEEADIALGGVSICSDLAAGYHPLDIAFDLVDTLGFTEFEGGFAVGLAANSICPEFSELVDAAANEALSGAYDTAA